MKIIGIYKITSPNNRIYIGQSRDCNTRKRRYSNLECLKQRRLYNSIKKYGWDAHKFEVIKECSIEKLNESEKYYVDLYQSFNSVHGLNLIDGGGAVGSRSIETREKNRIATKLRYDLGLKEKPIGIKNGMYGNGHKLLGKKNGRYGKPVSEETRKKISESNKKYYSEIGKRRLSESTKQKMSISARGNKNCLGRILSDATKEKMRQSALNRKNHKEIRG